MQATTNVNVKNSLPKTKRKHSRGSKANIEAVKLPEELVDLIKDDTNQSNYLGGIIAIIVIAFLLGLIALATYFTMPDPKNSSSQIPFYFSDIFKIASINDDLNFQWMNEILLYRNFSGDFYSIKASEMKSYRPSVLIPKQYCHRGMKASADFSAWIISTDQRKTQSLTDEFQFKLMTFANRKPYYEPLQINSSHNFYFNSVSWGPRYKQMVTVHQGNIYYSENPFIKNSFSCLSCKFIQGRFYGHFIGYYTKSIFKTNKAYWWSGDGNYLAFLSISEELDKLTNVEVHKLQSLFTHYANVSYSKAGTSPLPYQCWIYIANLKSKEIIYIALSRYVPFKPFYIIHIQWFHSSSLLTTILSRDQKKSAILLCSLLEDYCSVVLERVFSTGWINIVEYQSLISLEKNLFAIALTPSDEFSAKRHLALVKIEKGSKNVIKWLTMENYYIIKLYKFDAIYRNIFYLAVDSNVTSRHLYKTNIDNMVTECITCQIVSCSRNEFHFSSNSSIFLQECQSGSPKGYTLIFIRPENGQILQSVDLQWNQDVVNYLVNKSLPRVEYLPLQLRDSSQNYQILSKIYHPKHLNPAHVTKYPVLLILPDDPYNTNINDDDTLGWKEYLSSFLHFVVIQMEVRGAENHYFNYHTSLTNSLGVSDFYDILTGLRLLFDQRKYLDNSSIAVIGEKYGGYLASKLLFDHNEYPNFTCAVAINPIIDFSLYDSFFAERYFQKNRFNLYYQNSKFKFLSKSLKEFLLIHDMNQNDILFENSAKLMKNLIEENILFDYVPHYGSYSDASPWNRDKYTLKKITTFITNCFNKSSVKYSLLANKDFHSF